MVLAVALRPLEGPEDGAVVGVEDARVRREQLEVGDALIDQSVHLRERRIVDVAHDHVEAVVDGGVALGLGVPCVEAIPERTTPGLDREVDDAGRAAERGRPRARLEGVLGEGAAEGQLHVGVHVDAAGDDVASGRVDGPVHALDHAVEARAQGCDGLAVDEHVGDLGAIRVDDGAVGDERLHGCLLHARCPGPRPVMLAPVGQARMHPKSSYDLWTLEPPRTTIRGPRPPAPAHGADGGEPCP